jgi:hypothetical protein
MRAPLLSTAPTLAQISPPRVRNHLFIEAPPAASVERHRMTISATLTLSDTVGENHDDLVSLSIGAAVPPHGREFTMDQEPVMVL